MRSINTHRVIISMRAPSIVSKIKAWVFLLRLWPSFHTHRISTCGPRACTLCILTVLMSCDPWSVCRNNRTPVIKCNFVFFLDNLFYDADVKATTARSTTSPSKIPFDAAVKRELSDTVYMMTGCRSGWLSDWLSDRLTDCLTDWLSYSGEQDRPSASGGLLRWWHHHPS